MKIEEFGKYCNGEEIDVTVTMNAGEIIEGFISEEGVFQPHDGNEFYTIDELIEHAEKFEVIK